jgi:hypothetical protein
MSSYIIEKLTFAVSAVMVVYGLNLIWEGKKLHQIALQESIRIDYRSTLNPHRTATNYNK